jgi:hypothetical protein
VTKEQQALVLQNSGVKAKELELTADVLKTPKQSMRLGLVSKHLVAFVAPSR